jgi:hypothetical protein
MGKQVVRSDGKSKRMKEHKATNAHEVGKWAERARLSRHVAARKESLASPALRIDRLHRRPIIEPVTRLGNEYCKCVPELNGPRAS